MVTIVTIKQTVTMVTCSVYIYGWCTLYCCRKSSFDSTYMFYTFYCCGWFLHLFTCVGSTLLCVYTVYLHCALCGRCMFLHCVLSLCIVWPLHVSTPYMNMMNIHDLNDKSRNMNKHRSRLRPSDLFYAYY